MTVSAVLGTQADDDPIAAVVAGRKALQGARAQAQGILREYIRRQEAQFGHTIHLAYAAGILQKDIQAGLGVKSREDVARYERTYRAWIQEHPDDDLYGEPDWNTILGESGLLRRAS